jgi:hypothetical protein
MFRASCGSRATPDGKSENPSSLAWIFGNPCLRFRQHFLKVNLLTHSHSLAKTDCTPCKLASDSSSWWYILKPLARSLSMSATVNAHASSSKDPHRQKHKKDKSKSKSKSTPNPSSEKKRKSKTKDKDTSGPFEHRLSWMRLSVPPKFASDWLAGVREILDGMLMRYVGRISGTQTDTAMLAMCLRCKVSY